jgi:hypothetical protein
MRRTVRSSLQFFLLRPKVRLIQLLNNFRTILSISFSFLGQWDMLQSY